MTLNDPLSQYFRLSEAQKKALDLLGLKTVRDLFFHFPTRYEAAGEGVATTGVVAGTQVSLVGTLEKLATKKSWKRKIPISEGYLRDQHGRIKILWFNQPYIAKMYTEGSLVRATGSISGSGTKVYLANPELQRLSPEEAGLFTSETVIEHPTITEEEEQFFAFYPESRGVTSLWMRHAISKLLSLGALEHLEDPLPPDIIKKYHLPTLGSALVWIHAPKDLKDSAAARKRFAFEEIFFIQLARQKERAILAREKTFSIRPPDDGVKAFMNAFPFSATGAQKRAIQAILKDLASGHAMSRLLEGDVGSGKTAVAATAAYATVQTRPEQQNFGTLQVAYMAPTEILAKQHFESFIQYFEQFPIPIGLITGSGCYKFPSKIAREKATSISRAQLLKWVAGGEIPVVIGTHALIEKSVRFKHLALVVIDEQHRFGTNQRKKLAQKEPRLPHLLSMTATPIPRTLALTIYGDLDLTLLDEMPPGRKPIITEIVKPEGRGAMYEHIRTELQQGRQAYIICPRIDEPDPKKAFALQATSVKEEAKRLAKDVFPEYRLAILHSKLKPAEKDAVMQQFAAHEVDILVATSVVEVGVNVPNATMIVIEGAERFGLAQLHQLRGRVMRSTHQAYCYLCPESRGEATMKRLKALTSAKNGFELAEADLMQRGPGELGGRKQWGISDLGMEALKNLKLVEAARTEATLLVAVDDSLADYPLLVRELSLRAAGFHFE